MGFSVLLYNGMESSDDGFYITAFHTLGNENYLILALSIMYSYQIPKMLCSSLIFWVILIPFFLALLAYDRVIAICFHLRYLTINTNLRLLLILVGIWTLAFLLEVSPVTLASSLPYCASRVVHSSCCEHSPVYRLASFNMKLPTAKSLVVLLGPRSFIIFTYAVVVVQQNAYVLCYVLVLLSHPSLLGNLHLVQSSDLLAAILTVSVILPSSLLKTEELQEKIIKLYVKTKATPHK
uniref:G-protein coupled receptors family 1 profile domain-containing protein n=1 Tax=Oncorhynchus mykiss TaxID=8022 RepID=A0A8C7U3H7_ONCMY